LVLESSAEASVSASSRWEVTRREERTRSSILVVAEGLCTRVCMVLWKLVFSLCLFIYYSKSLDNYFLSLKFDLTKWDEESGDVWKGTKGGSFVWLLFFFLSLSLSFFFLILILNRLLKAFRSLFCLESDPNKNKNWLKFIYFFILFGYVDVKNKFLKNIKNIILIYLQVENILKNNCYHTFKYPLN